MQYPLEMRFNLFSISQQISVHDAAGQSILFVKQKMFRLKEKIEVFTRPKMQQKLFEINADRMLDFSANYHFTTADGSDWGAVRREGMRSLWSAQYDIYEDQRIDMTLREEEPWLGYPHRCWATWVVPRTWALHARTWALYARTWALHARTWALHARTWALHDREVIIDCEIDGGFGHLLGDVIEQTE